MVFFFFLIAELSVMRWHNTCSCLDFNKCVAGQHWIKRSEDQIQGLKANESNIRQCPEENFKRASERLRYIDQRCCTVSISSDIHYSCHIHHCPWKSTFNGDLLVEFCTLRIHSFSGFSSLLWCLNDLSQSRK